MNYFLFGPSGSGKGMESFTTFILPAMRQQAPDPKKVDDEGNLIPQGREIFGNVQMDLDKIESFLGHPVRYRFISDNLIRDPENWPNLSDPDELGNRRISPGKLFPSGALIWLDEARSIWRNNENVPSRILRAVDTQRHFSTDTGQGIDIIWSGTAKSHFHRDFRENGEIFYKLTSLEERGIKDAHRLTLFTDFRCRPCDAVPAMTGREIMHDKRLYGMYSSVATGVAAHHVLDNRIVSAKRTPKFFIWVMIGIFVAAIAACAFFLYYSATQTENTFKNATVPVAASKSKDTGNGFDVEEVCGGPSAVIDGTRYVVRSDAAGDGSVVAESESECAKGTGGDVGRNRAFDAMDSIGL